MLRHAEIWGAIDRLARENGFSASGLARRAGLDPTTFNRSKRVTRDDKQRWPSTESIAKILEATGATLGEFVSYVGDGSDGGTYRNVPLIGFAQAGTSGYFDDAGYPVGGSWDEIRFPGLADAHAYALEITGNSMEPAYRDGDIVIISPEANTRRGDRVIVKTTDGEIMAKQLLRSSVIKIELTSFNPEHEDRSILVKDIDWIARIIWASQ